MPRKRTPRPASPNRPSPCYAGSTLRDYRLPRVDAMSPASDSLLTPSSTASEVCSHHAQKTHATPCVPQPSFAVLRWKYLKGLPPASRGRDEPGQRQPLDPVINGIGGLFAPCPENARHALRPPTVLRPRDRVDYPEDSRIARRQSERSLRTTDRTQTASSLLCPRLSTPASAPRSKSSR